MMIIIWKTIGNLQALIKAASSDGRALAGCACQAVVLSGGDGENKQ